MKTRCSNPRQIMAHRYVNRGIKVCDRWLHSFENFLEDMGEAPAGHSMDRIKNDLGYSKDNCRWATKRQQCNNTSRSRVVEFNGEAMTIAQLADKIGVRYMVLYGRLRKRTVDQALAIPFRQDQLA